MCTVLVRGTTVAALCDNTCEDTCMYTVNTFVLLAKTHVHKKVTHIHVENFNKKNYSTMHIILFLKTHSEKLCTSFMYRTPNNKYFIY